MGDAQEHAEFVAYAINYISAISKDAPVRVITFAQGSVNCSKSSFLLPEYQ